jgi:rhodanese-related sulfurtransferase
MLKIINRKYLIITTLILLGIGGIIFISQTKSSDSPTNVMSIQTIIKDVAKGGQLVDVRTAKEYAVSHIEKAVNLPLQDIQSSKFPIVSKDKPIYLYCRTGNRSSQATKLLKSAGFRNIVDLGGMGDVQTLGGILIK